MITELNGDNTVAAIFINRASLRGCIDSNNPYPGGNPNEISYSIKEVLKNHTFKITVTQIVHGSMRHHDSNIIVKFVNREYILKDKTVKKALVLEKIGEW